MTARDPFGIDWSTFVGGVPDLDPTFTPVRDASRNVTEDLARRLTTKRGSFRDDPDAGTDVREYVQARMGALKIAQLRQAVEQECHKSERVKRAAAVVSFDRASGKIRIAVSGEGVAGKFSLTVVADELTVELLNSSG